MQKIQAPEPGIYCDIPFNVYMTWNAAHKSTLTMMEGCPADVRYAEDNPRKSKPEYEKGSLCHTYSLEPEELLDRYFSVPTATRRNTKAWKAAEAQAGGKILVKQGDLNEAKAMRAALYDEREAKKLISHGDTEVSVVWVDSDTGVTCKARLDKWHPSTHMIVDLKTARRIDPGGFSTDAATFKYHVQAAMYIDGVQAVTGFRDVGFTFVAQAKEAPYPVRTFTWHRESTDAGRLLYKSWLHEYADCVKRGVWAKRPSETMVIRLPAWALPWEDNNGDNGGF
jgi:hypothetical protein